AELSGRVIGQALAGGARLNLEPERHRFLFDFKVGHGKLSVLSGQSPVVHGPWSVVSGPLSGVRCRSSAASCQWSVARRKNGARLGPFWILDFRLLPSLH